MSKEKNIIGSNSKPRVSVFRSNKFISAQAINDEKGITILSKSSKIIKSKQKPIEKAFETGKVMGEGLKSLKITEIVFDRNNYRYHGQVKSFADGIRQAGIKF